MTRHAQRRLSPAFSRRPRVASQIENRRSAGAPARSAPEEPTLGAWLDQWIEDRIVPGHALGTVATYRYCARRISKELSDYPLSFVTPQHIARLYRRLLSGDQVTAPLNANTLVSYHAVLHQAFAYAVQLRLIEASPVIPPPRGNPSTRPFVLTREQIQRLLQACDDDATRVRLALLVRTGIRRGECDALRWADTDLEHHEIRIFRSLQRYAGLGYCVVEPKTRHATRTIAISASMADALRQHRDQQQNHAAAVSARWDESWLLFGGTDGQPVPWSQHWRAFDRARQLAGLPTLRLHDLRHAAAGLMVQAGIHPKVMSARLGHSTIQVTLDLYSHVLPEMEEQAAEAVERVLVSPRLIVNPAPVTNVLEMI